MAGVESTSEVVVTESTKSTTLELIRVLTLCSVLFEIPKKIARIRQQDYLKGEWQNLYTKNNLPIDAIISPEQEEAWCYRYELTFIDKLTNPEPWLKQHAITQLTNIQK